MDPPGAEDVQGAREEEMLVLVGGDDPALEVDDEPVCGQEVHPEDGLLDVGHLKVPLEPPALELEGNHSGSVAEDGGYAGSHKVVA